MKAGPGMKLVPTDMLKRSLAYWKAYRRIHSRKRLETPILLIEAELKGRAR